MAWIGAVWMMIGWFVPPCICIRIIWSCDGVSWIWN